MTQLRKDLVKKKQTVDFSVAKDDVSKELMYGRVLRDQFPHPHLLGLACEDQQFEDTCHIYMTMPFARDGSLYDLVKDHGPLCSPVKWARLLLQLSSALQHMHTILNVVHFDVSCENVLLLGNGNYALCDFGLVQSLSAPPPCGPVGKMQYMVRPLSLFTCNHTWRALWVLSLG